MSSKQNIEDLFHEGLGDFQIKPSGKVWSSINKQMTGPRLEASCRNAFEGFKVDPSKFLWRRVAAALWFEKFLHFTPFSFNVYYLAILTTAIVGTVITVNNVPDLEFKRFDENTYKVQISDSLYADNSVINSVNNILNPTLASNKFIDPDDQIASNEDFLVANSEQISNQNINPLSANQKISIKNDQKPEKSILKENKVSSNLNPKLVKDAPIINEPVQVNDKILVDNNSREQNSDENIAQLQLSAVEVELPEKHESDIKAIPLKLFVKNSLKLFYSPQWFELADNVFAGIARYDEIVKDTIGYNYLGEPVIIDKSWLEIGAFYSPYLYSTFYSLTNNELVSNYEMYKNAISTTYSWGAGLSVSYNFNRFRIESGFSYLSLCESFSQFVKSYDTLTVYSYDYFTNNRWDVDTTMILDLDEYLQGNTVYIPFIDSVAVSFEDSLLLSRADSVLVNTILKAASSLRYIEMPLIGGYEFTYGKFAITPKAGIIFGLLVGENGTTYNVIDGKVVSISSMSLNKLIFDYYGAINLQYRCGEHFSVFAEPHIRGLLKSSFKESYPVDSRNIKYGIRTGISYRF